MFGFVTVKDGKRIALWNKQGKVEFVDGPRRLFVFDRTIEYLEHYSAGAEQYLVIEYQDGHCENIAGPAAIWYDPVHHKQIDVKQALAINSHEAVVVYKRTDETVERRVLSGPAVYVPCENEWLHKFSWHGADPKDPYRKIPRALSFTRLRTIPDQMYYDVSRVRTSDDALVEVKLMIFFELVEVEKMLDQTHDPIADFINAVSADVIDFVSGLSFEGFKQNTEQLNNLETFENLNYRAQRIGYKINKVVYRGYKANDKLQEMHNNAIETRTRLKLEAETESQAQELADLKLQREAQRDLQKQEMEQKSQQHKLKLEKLVHEETLRKLEAEQKSELTAKQNSNELELRHLQAANAEEVKHLQATNSEKVNYLKAIEGMQVDLTRYLVAQYQNPDKLIRIADDKSPQLHLHN